ncbi:MAG: hypothetical protein K8T91_00530 [Planctomycetes bacterium]|nr:hypothetical protein [Planctomycetota bacterium]
MDTCEALNPRRAGLAWLTAFGATLLPLFLVLIPMPWLGSSMAEDLIATTRTRRREIIYFDVLPFYIRPYIVSATPAVSVGPYSNKLANAEVDSIMKVAEEMKRDRKKLSAEAMYVLSIRLFNLGHKNEAVYWYNSAKLRASLFTRIAKYELRTDSEKEGYNIWDADKMFQKEVGKYINHWAHGDLDMLATTYKAVLEDGKGLPDITAAYPGYRFIEKADWNTKNDEALKQFQNGLDYILKEGNKIREKRKKDGDD